jgi:hypothetical protein
MSFQANTIIDRLTDDAKNLLKEAYNNSPGIDKYIKIFRRPGLLYVITNGKEFYISEGDMKKEALVEEALEILENNGLMEADSPSRDLFKITAEGLRIAKILPD